MSIILLRLKIYISCILLGCSDGKCLKEIASGVPSSYWLNQGLAVTQKQVSSSLLSDACREIDTNQMTHVQQCLAIR